MHAKQSFQKGLHDETQRGQGLVEYALILVLVAVVVIVILALLGPSIGDVFSQVNGALNMDVRATAQRTGGGHGNDVVVQVTVTERMNITLTHPVSGATVTMNCENTCSHTFSGVGDTGGTIHVAAPGVVVRAGYPAKL